MANQPPPAYGRNASQIPSGLFGVLTVLTAGLVLAFLYFARDVIVPIALAVLLSFLLAPAVRWLRRLQLGRVAAITLTVLIAFLAMLGFAAVVVQEISSLAQQLPAYRSNLEAKIRSLPEVVPGGGIVHRVTAMARELGRELTQSETQIAKSSDDRSALDTSPAEPAKPVPVVIQRPEFEPLQIVQSVVGPLLQPLAMAGLVIVFVVMILLGREDLRDRLLRLAGRRDLHRTTVAMDDAAGRISRYLSRQLLVNALRSADRFRSRADRYSECCALGNFCSPAALSALSRDRHRRVLSCGTRRGGRPRVDAAALGSPAVCRDRARRHQRARALGLRRQHWSVLGRADCGSDFLDLAMGPDRVTAVGAVDSVPRRTGSSRAAARVSRCTARQRARALTR